MRQLGKIQCLEINNDPPGALPQDENPWIILFHGYGADAQDLFSLGQLIHTKKPCNWLFPQGHLEVPIGPAWTGRAWWPVNMLEIQVAATRGETRDFSTLTPPGMVKARDMAFEMIKQLRVPWNKIILGGFSQGAMLATELYLNAPETPKGLAILSGTLLHQDEWKPLIAKRAGEPFFQSHGESDSVLGIRQARQLETLLCQNGMKGHLNSFPGGHEIPPPILKKFGEFLDSRLS